MPSSVTEAIALTIPLISSLAVRLVSDPGGKNPALTTWSPKCVRNAENQLATLVEVQMKAALRHLSGRCVAYQIFTFIIAVVFIVTSYGDHTEKELMNVFELHIIMFLDYL